VKQIKKLQQDELKQIYKAHIREDFPRNERRPYSSMEQMTNEGKYASYGYYDDNRLLAYACYILTEDGMYALLDYSREATSQVAMLARIFGDCREGQMPGGYLTLQ